jgi:hypothetical protein
MRVLEDVYNPRCEPPWKTKDIEHKLDAVEKTGDEWGADFDAWQFVEAVTHDHARSKEPSDEEDEPLTHASENGLVEWQGNVGSSLEELKSRGDPVPTGFPTLDLVSDGGQLPGEPFVIGGAPETGKTTLALDVALYWLGLGKNVAVAAYDEPKARIAVRVAQHTGFERAHLRKGAVTPEQIAELDLAKMRIFNGRLEGMTIEWVAEKLAAAGPGVLVIDSLQTCQIKDEPKDEDPTKQVAARCKAITKICEEHKHLVIVTSEIGRAYYQNYQQAVQLAPMAAFSGSRAVEYMMTFGVVLLRPPNPAEHVHARIAKNRLGAGNPDFGLMFDRARARAYECALPSGKDDADEDAPMPTIDLERLIWNVVRGAQPPLDSKRKIALVLRRSGHKLANSQIELAIAGLELDKLIYKDEDKIYMAGPWTRA